MMQVVYRISKLPSDQQEKARTLLWQAGGSATYSGILAAVDQRGSGGVWIWGKKGLRYYAGNEHTFYRYVEKCSPEAIAAITEQTTYLPPKETISTKVKDWTAKKGDYVYLYLGRADDGADGGVMHEVRAHDWWAFLPTVRMEAKVCGR